MTKTLISLATASLIASSAMAADKGIDFTTTGQAVVYYQTNGQGDADLFSQDSSRANIGLQLNIGADLGNSFTFGSQINYLGTAGLEKNLVSDTLQSTTGVGAMGNISDEITLSKIFVAKQIANTTVKIGRQELPKSLSPLAFSEDWNVFKNTFEAILVVNSDVPDTTIVAAYVGQSNANLGANMATFNNLTAVTTLGSASVNGTAYMLTAQNTSLPMTTVTASYYTMNKITGANGNRADALWLDAKIADKSLPMGLNVGLQYGSIMPDLAITTAEEDTTAFGVKVAAKPMDALSLTAAFTSVDEGTVAIKNVGTGIKTPLYTQMVFNQNYISLASDTIMVKGAYSLGDAGTVIAQFSSSTAANAADDYLDMELLYKVKAGGVNFLAAYLNTTVGDTEAVNTVRVWARYAF
jgi:hypothetical protein